MKNQLTSDLDTAIDKIEAEIANGAHIPKRNRPRGDSWGGANVIVTSDELRTGDPGDFVLVTSHAIAVGWYFDRVKRISYKKGGIDHLSKDGFFRYLAKAVADLPRDADEQRVFKTLLAKTRASLVPKAQGLRDRNDKFAEPE
jgi:hypothetical protein